jgi:glycosyltransferase involved in cell wall biosynthesis
MNITFFGFQSSFDFHQIGGTDSYFRRLGLQLSSFGHHVSFVHYGCQRDSTEHPATGITVYRYVSFKDALERITRAKKSVLVNAIHRKDRLRFIRFRNAKKDKIKFFFVASLFSESWLRRNLYFLEASLYPYNGGVLCMSPRLIKASRLRRNRAELILPPVPEQYYVHYNDKPRKEKLFVTYMGRTVAGKGVDQAIEIFKRLRNEPQLETQICGYTWPDKREDNFIHNWLLTQSDIKYVCEKYQGWSPKMEKRTAEILRNTDILILPYKRLSSTIDMPLLLLEGMAANCCVITKPLGDIPMTYGLSPLVLPEKGFIETAVDLILQIERDRNIIQKERQRVAKQINSLDCSVTSISRRLLGLLC